MFKKFTAILVSWAFLISNVAFAFEGNNFLRATALAERAHQLSAANPFEFVTLKGERIQMPPQLIKAFKAHVESGKRTLVIGVPKEIKPQATRVGLTPAGVKFFTSHGIKVIVQRGAGNPELNGKEYADEEYAKAGAELVDTAEEVWNRADIIKKVKEPLKNESVDELALMREGQIIFTYLHLSSSELKGLTKEMLNKKVTGLAYETVTIVENGKRVTPMLRPMSIIAGELGAYYAMAYLEDWMNHLPDWSEEQDPDTHLKYSKERLEKIKREYPNPKGYENSLAGEEAVILGGGVSGEAMARRLLEAGASVTITDTSDARLKELETIFSKYKNKLTLINPGSDINNPPAELLKKYRSADILGGCILAGPGAVAPKMEAKLLKEISDKKKKIIIDIALDQGGNFEGSHSLTYEDPAFVDDNKNIRFCVPNMPDAVGAIASVELEKSNIAYTLALSMGLDEARKTFSELNGSVNTYAGSIANEQIGNAYPGLPHVSYFLDGYDEIRAYLEKGNIGAALDYIWKNFVTAPARKRKGEDRISVIEDNSHQQAANILVDMYLSAGAADGLKRNIMTLMNRMWDLCTETPEYTAYLERIPPKERVKAKQSFFAMSEELGTSEILLTLDAYKRTNNKYQRMAAYDLMSKRIMEIYLRYYTLKKYSQYSEDIKEGEQIKPGDAEYLPVVVTGGAGFVGARLVEMLLNNEEGLADSLLADKGVNRFGAKKIRIYVIDNFSTGEAWKLLKFQDAIKDGRLTVFPLDLSDRQGYQFLRENWPDIFSGVVLHEGAFVSVPESVKDPKACFEANERGSANIMNLTRRAGGKAVLVSTAAFTRQPSLKPDGTFKDNDETSPYNPATYYGFTKAVMEHLGKMMRFERVPLKETMIAYANVAGPGQMLRGEASLGPAIGKFVWRYINGLDPEFKFTIFDAGYDKFGLEGDGRPGGVRNYISVELAAASAIKAALALEGEFYRISSSPKWTMTTEEFFNRFAAAIKRKLKNPKLDSLVPKTGPWREGDIPAMQFDNTKMVKKLNPPFVDMDSDAFFDRMAEFYLREYFPDATKYVDGETPEAAAKRKTPEIEKLLELQQARQKADAGSKRFTVIDATVPPSAQPTHLTPDETNRYIYQIHKLVRTGTVKTPAGIVDEAIKILRGVNPNAGSMMKALDMLRVAMETSQPLAEAVSIVGSQYPDLNDQERGALAFIANPSVEGITVTQGGAFVGGHRGPGSFNEQIAQRLVEYVQSLVSDRKIGESTAAPIIKNLRAGKKLGPTMLRSLGLGKDIIMADDKKSLMIVELPVEQLGVSQDGTPFTAHIAFGDGIIWVAGKRNTDNVNLDIQHELKEYNLAWDYAKGRGWTMEEMAMWRDEASKEAQTFFHTAHKKAWFLVSAVFFERAKTVQARDTRLFERYNAMANMALKYSQDAEIYPYKEVTSGTGIAVAAAINGEKKRQPGQGMGVPSERVKFLSGESLRDLEENTAGEQVDTVFVGLMCADKIHQTTGLPIEGMVEDDLVLGGNVPGSVDPGGKKLEAYLQGLPPEVRTSLSDLSKLQSGGPASSAARVCAQLSRPKQGGRTQVSFISSVGRQDGQPFVDAHAALGINMDGVARSDQATSDTIIAELGGSRRAFLHTVNAAADLTIKALKPEFFRGKKVAEFGGIELTGLMPDLYEALKMAKDAGCITVLDTVVDRTRQWKAFRQKYGADYLKKILNQVDVFAPSIKEAQQIAADYLWPDNQEYATQIAGTLKAEDLVEFFIGNGAKAVFLKAGKDGVYVQAAKNSIYSKGIKQQFHVPIYRGFRDLSGTGTGDAFCGALVYAAARGWDARKTAMFANVVGGMCVQYKGGTIGDEALVDALYYMERLRAQMLAEALLDSNMYVRKDARELLSRLKQRGFSRFVAQVEKEMANLLYLQAFPGTTALPPEQIEKADFGLGDFDNIGLLLEVVTIYNAGEGKGHTGKVLINTPNQLLIEHQHKTIVVLKPGAPKPDGYTDIKEVVATFEGIREYLPDGTPSGKFKYAADNYRIMLADSEGSRLTPEFKTQWLVEELEGKSETFMAVQGDGVLLTDKAEVVYAPPAVDPHKLPPGWAERVAKLRQEQGNNITTQNIIYMTAGVVVKLPKNTKHAFLAGDKGAVYVEFSGPSIDEADDFTDKRVVRLPKEVVLRGGEGNVPISDIIGIYSNIRPAGPSAAPSKKEGLNLLLEKAMPNLPPLPISAGQLGYTVVEHSVGEGKGHMGRIVGNLPNQFAPVRVHPTSGTFKCLFGDGILFAQNPQVVRTPPMFNPSEIPVELQAKLDEAKQILEGKGVEGLVPVYVIPGVEVRIPQGAKYAFYSGDKGLLSLEFTSPEAAAAQAKKTVLLATDDKGFARFMKEILEDRGYEVTVFDTAEGACGALMDRGFTIVITDLGLKEGDRYGKVVLSMARGKGIPAVLMTGSLEELSGSDLLALKDDGADAILSKPFSDGIERALDIIDKVSLISKLPLQPASATKALEHRGAETIAAAV